MAARLRFACLPTDSSLDAFDFTAQPGVSHTGITEWGERLGDPMLAATVLDRLLHTGIVVSIDGLSYRMRAYRQRSDALRPASESRPL